MIISNKNKRAYFLAAQLSVVIYLLAGFYPFQSKTSCEYEIHNGVIAEPDQPLRFRSPGIAYTEKVPVWLSRAIRTSSFELSLDVRTADQAQKGLARIFTVSHNRSRIDIVVGQWASNLNVRIRNPYTRFEGPPTYIIKHVFDDPDWHQIDVIITSEALKIRVDGKVSVTVPMPDRPLERWDADYRLALGNEFFGDRPWLGDIRKAVVRVDGRSYDYLVPGALRYPDKLPVKSSQVAKLVPFVDTDFSRSALLDWTINLLGFVPFGWLVVMARRPRPGFVLAIAFSAGISLTIEAGQLLFFAHRVPSIDDFILNILGAALGAWLTERYLPSAQTTL
ncbi:MAG TPA: hypothetical protein ENI74_02790 [Gammaproteobacteria bacterium]|nr:hypothetical protein [Gammaproteobacteria bacterium]